MNIISTIKTLPAIGILAIGLALSPNAAMADKGDRNGHKGQYSQQYPHDAGKSHNRTGNNKNMHKGHTYDRHGHKKARKNNHKKHYGNHRYDRHGHHAYRAKHGHDHRGHSHDHYVVHEHRDHYVDFDDLRFMIGLHTDQFDIILRD